MTAAEAVLAFLGALECDPRPVYHACIRWEHWPIEGPRLERLGASWLALPLTYEGEPAGLHVWSDVDFRGEVTRMPLLLTPPQVAGSFAIHFAAAMTDRPGLPLCWGGLEEGEDSR